MGQKTQYLVFINVWYFRSHPQNCNNSKSLELNYGLPNLNINWAADNSGGRSP